MDEWVLRKIRRKLALTAVLIPIFLMVMLAAFQEGSPIYEALRRNRTDSAWFSASLVLLANAAAWTVRYARALYSPKGMEALLRTQAKVGRVSLAMWVALSLMMLAFLASMLYSAFLMCVTGGVMLLLMLAMQLMAWVRGK